MTVPVLEIAVTPVRRPEALSLIAESEAELAGLYAPEARHAFSPDQLEAAGVVFMLGWRNGRAVACGGYASLRDPAAAAYAELKRVFTTATARGQGLGRLLVAALEEHATRAGHPVMRLETGEASPDALALYARCGYARRPPFGAYRENGSSVFLEKSLAELAGSV